jgi:tyrosyl-tRNA synthetase
MDDLGKFELVKRNTEEILTEDELRELVRKKFSIYYGISPTGPFHIGYLIPLGKLYEILSAGIASGKILIADIHAALDDLKTPWEKTQERANYYKKCVELCFPWENIKLVLGSSFQKKSEYQMDVLKLSTYATISRATRAASEVTRMKNPKVSELIYPIMQALDEEYLGVDAQIGGIDQRHIMAFAREFLPILGYRKRVEIMTPLVCSLKGPGTKMSASIPESHIKIYESEESIKKKISAAYCPYGETKDNPVIQIAQFIVFPVKKKLKIEREAKYGGNVEYESFEDLKKDYEEKKIHPKDLKDAIAKELIDIFKNARKYFEKNTETLKELGQEFLPL